MEPKVEEEIAVEKPAEDDKKNKKKGGKGPQKPNASPPKKTVKKKKEVVPEVPPESPLLFEVFEPATWPEPLELEEGQEPVESDKEKYEKKLAHLIKIVSNEFNE